MRHKLFSFVLLSFMSFIALLVSNVFLLGYSESNAEEIVIKDVDEYLSRSKYEFKLLRNEADSTTYRYWDEKYYQAMQHFIDKSEELKKLRDFLIKEGAYDEHTFPFSYVNEVNEILLNDITNLVNELGESIIKEKVKDRIDSVKQQIEKDIDEISHLKNANKVANIISEFYQIIGDVSELTTKLEAKYSYMFEPKNYAHAEPYLVKKFKIKDWVNGINKIESYRERLLKLRNEIKLLIITSPKDPLFFITIMFQVTLLLSTIPRYIISYTGKVPKTFIVLMIVSSMIFSFVLIFVSPSTFLNVLVQCIVPGLFIIYGIRYEKVKEMR